MAEGAGDAGEDRFRWHPNAQLFGPDGQAQVRFSGLVPPVIPPHLGPGALSALFAAADAGQCFRVGGPSDVPIAGAGWFETLTGGSTGSPRRILRTQASWIASFRVNAGLFGIGPGARVAVMGALSHSLALYGAIEALHLGADLHFLAGCSPTRQMRLMRERGVDTLYATPVQLRLLADGGLVPVPCLRHVIVGGGALDGDLRQRLAQMFPKAAVRAFYGASETSFVALSDAGTPEAAAGVPYPGVEIAIRGAADAGDVGAVWVRSPYLASGYAGGDQGSAQWVDGWVSVGELGRVNDGQLTIVGRVSRMLRIADQSVYPEEIEAFLRLQPGVRDAAVLPRPDARRGQVLEAVLRGDAGVEQAVLTAARVRFGQMAAPRRAHWREDWPLLASGKPDLAALLAGLP